MLVSGVQQNESVIHTHIYLFKILFSYRPLCTAKETINQVKRKPSEWEKVFANEATDKGLISKTYKQLVKINNVHTHTQITQSKNGLQIILTFFQRYTDGYKAHEKMCNITNF